MPTMTKMSKLSVREPEIQKALLQVLIQEENPDALAIEFPFDFGRRRADAICIANNQLSGYEIKSIFDRVDRLPDQIESYKKLFDFVYVVCDKHHYRKINKLISKSTGIYIFNDGIITKKRSAKNIRNTDIMTTLDAIPMQQLRIDFKLTANSKLELCKKIKDSHSRELIREKIKNYISNKYAPQTTTFRSEASQVLTLDDILSLTLNPQKLTP